MARPVNSPELEPNPDRLIELIMKAKGTRSQRQFASDCNISTTHLTRIFSKQNENVPSVSFLYKIAKNASNEVSFDDLLLASGYDPAKHRDDIVKQKESDKFRGIIDSNGNPISEKKEQIPGMDEIYDALLLFVFKEAQCTINVLEEERDEHSLTLKYESPNLGSTMWHFIIWLPGDDDAGSDVKMLCKLLPNLNADAQVSFVDLNSTKLVAINSLAQKYKFANRENVSYISYYSASNKIVKHSFMESKRLC